MKAIKRTWDVRNATYEDEIIAVPDEWDFGKTSYEQEDLFYVNCGSNQEVLPYYER